MLNHICSQRVCLLDLPLSSFFHTIEARESTQNRTNQQHGTPVLIRVAPAAVAVRGGDSHCLSGNQPDSMKMNLGELWWWMITPCRNWSFLTDLYNVRPPR